MEFKRSIPTPVERSDYARLSRKANGKGRALVETAIDGVSLTPDMGGMIRTPLLLTLAAAAALAGCDQSDHTIVQNGPVDTMANELAAAPPVELPKPIVASHSYRCRDNSLVYVDWLAENSGANVRTERTSASTPLKPGEDGQPPFTAEGGYSISGTPEDTSVTIAMPGADSQTCRRG